MNLGNKRTGRVDNLQILSFGSFHNGIGYAMSTEDSYRSGRDAFHVFGKNDSARFQILDYLLVMNNLV